jgi:hypothetical protein
MTFKDMVYMVRLSVSSADVITREIYFSLFYDAARISGKMTVEE